MILYEISFFEGYSKIEGAKKKKTKKKEERFFRLFAKVSGGSYKLVSYKNSCTLFFFSQEPLKQCSYSFSNFLLLFIIIIIIFIIGVKAC